MSAPTLWEEGTWSGSRVTRLCILLTVVLAGAELATRQHLGLYFDIGFVVLCVFAALAVRPDDFFRVGVLPPALMAGLCLVLALGWTGAIARPGDGVVQGMVTGLAHRSAALGTGYALALLVLAIRHRVLRRAIDRGDYSNRSVDPAPYRVISGGQPSEKSTTVVGEGITSPESRTASSS